jgi:hypothetical protein
MQQPSATTGVNQAVVARVFREYRGIREVLEELERSLIGEVRPKPLAIT